MERKIFGYLPILVLAAVAILYRQQLLIIFNSLWYQSPCNSPLKYRIGQVDPRFGLKADQLAADAKEAGQIWSRAYGKDLYQVDPQAELTVNMVFDERQMLNDQITKMEGQVNTNEGTIKEQVAKYEADLAAFKKKLADFNAEVDAWNQKGGAPPEIYNQLMAEQKDLRTQADALNSRARQLNQTASNFNADINNLNATINTFNSELTMRPEEGLYDGRTNSITIYFNVSRRELVHTLAHEFGHAIGMGHVDDQKAIMFSRTNQAIAPAQEDLAQLKLVCRQRSLPEIFEGKLLFFLQNLKRVQV